MQQAKRAPLEKYGQKQCTFGTVRFLKSVVKDATPGNYKYAHGLEMMVQVRRKSGRQQGILNFELYLEASASTTKTTLDNVMEEYDDAVSTSWSSSSASPPQLYEQRSMPTATAQRQYYQSRSTSAVSAPPLPQYYQRETVSTVTSARQQREMERSIGPEASSYGFESPMATMNPVSQQDEISLLHSYV